VFFWWLRALFVRAERIEMRKEKGDYDVDVYSVTEKKAPENKQFLRVKSQQGVVCVCKVDRHTRVGWAWTKYYRKEA